MVRRPILHALFHSVASLGYIPFALTSVLVSSSTPFVSIPSIGIILVAFIPPLTSFPLLCFSYRYLERFECISLTVQRARTYVMLAGSGLCFLVATHLMMVHLLANEHNTMYHQIPDSSSAQPFQVSQPVTVAPVVIQTDVGQGSTDVTARDKDSGTAQAMPLGISEGSKDTLQKTEPWPLSFLSGYWINVPVQEVQGIQEQESIGEDSVPLMQDLEPVDRPLFKTLVPTHLLNPSTPVTLRPSGTGEEPQPQQQERDMVSSQKQQQLFFIVEQPVAVSSDEIQVVDTHASLPIPTTDPPTIGLQSFTPVPSEPQNFPKSTGPTNAAAAIRFHAPVTVSPEPPLHLPDDNSTSRISGASTAGHVDDGDDPFFRRSQDRSPGYNLAGLHWLIYLAFQGILTFLLIMLFLGVLILTEYVLDREDEDLENLTALFWARVIGIASATIASAAHGSLLSGYVLLDGTSDWIAKATVGMICGYWGSMVWIMNCVAGPLPY